MLSILAAFYFGVAFIHDLAYYPSVQPLLEARGTDAPSFYKQCLSLMTAIFLAYLLAFVITAVAYRRILLRQKASMEEFHKFLNNYR